MSPCNILINSFLCQQRTSDFSRKALSMCCLRRLAKFGALSPCKESGPKKNMSDFGRKAVNMCCSRRLADALKQRHGHCMHCPPAMCGGHALERHNASAYFFDICAYDICADVPIAPMVNPYSTCSYRVHVICAERAMNFCPCPTRHQFSHKPLST